MVVQVTTPDKLLTVRVPADLHGALQALARLNERTVAAEVRLAIRDRLEQMPGYQHYPSAAQVMEQDS